MANSNKAAAEHLGHLPTLNTSTGGARDDSSAEGLVLAYGSIILMSLLPIIIGSWRSVSPRRPATQRTVSDASRHGTPTHRSSSSHQSSDDHPAHNPSTQQPSSKSDVLRLALHASIIVLLFCVIGKFVSRHIIVLGLKAYVYVLASLALAHSISPICHLLVPSSVPNVPFHILFIKGDGSHRRSLINYKFTTYDIICLLLSVSIGIWYLLQKHWIPNNMLGLACSISSIEILQLNNVVTGYIMMSIFYLDTVFFTMGQALWESMASSCDLPILILFPKNLIAVAGGGGGGGGGEGGADFSGPAAAVFGAASAAQPTTTNYALMDVADIVIPGIFLALMLRIDHSMNRKLSVYFYATLLGYLLGVVMAQTVLIVFRLVYSTTAFLVPCCLVPPAFVALRTGDLKAFFSYDDATTMLPKDGETEVDDAATQTTSASSSAGNGRESRAR